ncbi:hypothetical protein GCM10028810_66030 [Spirosoma litoris]
MFAGGYYYTSASSIVSSNQVDIYDNTTNQWTTTMLSVGRSTLAAASSGSLALFAGGFIWPSNPFSGAGSFSATVDIYNSNTNQWTTSQLSEPRSNLVGASAGNKIVFAGGTTNLESNTVDIYDIDTNQWSVSQLPQLSGSGIAVTCVGTRLLFAKNGLLDIYDVTTGQWTTATIPLPTRNLGAVSIGNKALFAGGLLDTGRSNQVSIYNVDTNQWTTATLSEARYDLAATQLGNKAFFAGGADGSGALDIYDALTGQWSSTQLPHVRNGTVAITVGNKAFFVGNGINTVDIYTLDNVLPVKLISFSGNWTANIGAQLVWQTSLETNNDHFEIQRSTDAKSFETIGRLTGKGTTQDRTDYSFVDVSMPNPINYYRLRQVDFDGSARFSTIISVSRQDKQQPVQLSVYYTSLTSSLSVQLSTDARPQEMSIYDLQGRQVAAQLSPQASTNLSGLPTGVYIASVITADGQHLRARFVKF